MASSFQGMKDLAFDLVDVLTVGNLGCLIKDLVPPDLTFHGGFPNPSRFSPVSVPVFHHRHRAAMLTSPSTNTHPLLGLKPFILSKLSLTSQIRRHLRTKIGKIGKALAIFLRCVSSLHLLV
ncbi:hypothetical protein DY000_02058220 [Brassica cretica]|uniref:Uncharacterized protein n=1 Tax=Brassica cretica TaxID=69181 RepID=A0ABQ7AEX9_BRACR|nr:hypothetical protein DY000_02058220 [Brassica cretica]